MVEIEIFHYKHRFGIVRMAIRILGDLHLCPAMDQRHMKIIYEESNVRMGYWASKNNMKEYTVYATVIWMFDLDFVNNL
jgi:hypothetical protein